jgi:hypothetical protein
LHLSLGFAAWLVLRYWIGSLLRQASAREKARASFAAQELLLLLETIRAKVLRLQTRAKAKQSGQTVLL